MKKKKFLFLLLFSLISISVFAETVRLKIGDTKTLSPSVLQQKVLAGQPAWTSSRPNDVKIVSTTMYSCKIEAVNSFSGYATIHCLYYFRELDPTTGRYLYQRSGYVDYHVFGCKCYQTLCNTSLYSNPACFSIVSTSFLSISRSSHSSSRFP